MSECAKCDAVLVLHLKEIYNVQRSNIHAAVERMEVGFHGPMGMLPLAHMSGLDVSVRV